MKRACFQPAIAAIAGLLILRAAVAAGDPSPSWLERQIADLRPRVQECLAGRCSGDPEVLWVLARNSGDSRVIRTLSARPKWMEAAGYQLLLSSISTLPAPQPRLRSDPPEVWKLPGVPGSARPVVVLEHATGFPGERLLAVLAPEPAPREDRSEDGAMQASARSRPAAGLRFAIVLSAALLLGGTFLARRHTKRTASTLGNRAATGSVLSKKMLQEAIYRSRSRAELGANLSSCIRSATDSEMLFLDYDPLRSELFERGAGEDSLRATLDAAGISPASMMPDVPSLRSAILRHRDASCFMAWPMIADIPGSRLLGVLVALRPTHRLRAAAGEVAIALERAARYHQSILPADGCEDRRQESRDGPHA